jgi:DNA end-binding protein Ku
LTDEDFEQASLKKTKTIEILDVTDENEIDPIYYEKPYFLAPDKETKKPYYLLKETLKQPNKV